MKVGVVYSKCRHSCAERKQGDMGDLQNAQSRAGVNERKDFNGAVDRKP